MSLWRKRQIDEHDDDDGLEVWHVCMAIMAGIGAVFLILLFFSLIALWFI